MKKRILFVSNTAWSIANFRVNLMKKLAENGFEIVALTPNDDFKKNIPFQHYDINMSNRGTNPLADTILFFKFLRLFKKIDPDLIMSFTIKPNIYGTIAANILKIPIVVNVAGLGSTFRKSNFVSWVTRNLYNYSLPKASCIFFQNEDDLKIIKRSVSLSKTQVGLLPGSGVDINKFTPQKKEISENFKFLMLGRFLKEKGIGEYVKAGAELKQIHKNLEIQLLGFVNVENPSAITKSEIDKWQNKGFINYLGSTDDVCKYIAKADCIVLPSYYGEGVPRSLLEAASMGKPIITTDNVGCKEVVQNSINGLICRKKDYYDLKEKMSQMIKLSEQERYEMGQKGREIVEKRFDENIVLRKNIKVINKLI